MLVIELFAGMRGVSIVMFCSIPILQSPNLIGAELCEGLGIHEWYRVTMDVKLIVLGFTESYSTSAESFSSSLQYFFFFFFFFFHDVHTSMFMLICIKQLLSLVFSCFAWLILPQHRLLYVLKMFRAQSFSKSP